MLKGERKKLIERMTVIDSDIDKVILLIPTLHAHTDMNSVLSEPLLVTYHLGIKLRCLSLTLYMYIYI